MANEIDIGFLRDTLALPEINISSTEFDAILQQLVAFVRENSDNTDFLAHGNTVLLMEWVAYVTSMLSYKQDFNINQAFLPTAVSDEAVSRLLEQIGIKLSRPRPGFTPVNVVILDKNGSDTSPLVLGTSSLPLRLTGTNEAEERVTYELFSADFENIDTGVTRVVSEYSISAYQDLAAPQSFQSVLTLSQVSRFPELDETGFYRLTPGSMTLTWQYPGDPTVYSVVDTPSTENPNLGIFDDPALVTDPDPLLSATVINYNTGEVNILFDTDVGIPLVNLSTGEGPTLGYVIAQVDPVPVFNSIGAVPLTLSDVNEGSGILALAVEGRTLPAEFLSTGAVNQAFFLGGTSVIESDLGFFTVEVGYRNSEGEFIGTPWTEVESLAATDPQDPVKNFYELTVDKDFRVTVRFGNGVTSSIPPAGSIISVSYRVGGGLRGVVSPHSLDKTITTEKNGTTYRIRIENPNPVSNATDGETTDRAKELAPQFFESQRRAVTGQDYTVFANRFPEANVLAVSALIKNTAAANIIRIYSLKQQSSVDSSTLITLNTVDKSRLLSYLTEYKMESDTLEISDGQLVMINMDLDVFIKENANAGEVLEDLTARIDTFFDPFDVEGPEYGKDFRISEFLSDLQCVNSDILYLAFNNVEGLAFRPLPDVDQTAACTSPPTGETIPFNDTLKVVELEAFQIMSKGCINLRINQL